MIRELPIRPKPTDPPDLFLRERIQDRFLLEDAPLRPDFPTISLLLLDQGDGSIRRVSFPPLSGSPSVSAPLSPAPPASSVPGGILCSGGAAILSSGSLIGTLSPPSSASWESQSGSLAVAGDGSLTYTPRT